MTGSSAIPTFLVYLAVSCSDVLFCFGFSFISFGFFFAYLCVFCCRYYKVPSIHCSLCCVNPLVLTFLGEWPLHVKCPRARGQLCSLPCLSHPLLFMFPFLPFPQLLGFYSALSEFSISLYKPCLSQAEITSMFLVDRIIEMHFLYFYI